MTQEQKEQVSEFLLYEIASSPFASFIGLHYFQNITAIYFAWKVKRKFNKYLLFKAKKNGIKQSS
ncbi:MAG TPA: hypothetical protein VI815_02810 [Candidatus Nanoarchaeia archaeon]|nr:hypothetical protein [Candidatus Nanoarchaeia archaeon]